MLEVVHTLIKYAQRQDIFICEFIDAVKSIEAKLHQLYVDFFVSMAIVLLTSSLLFVNIVVSYYPSLGFHMSLMLFCTYCHTWHSTLLATIAYSIIVEVLMVLMFM